MKKTQVSNSKIIIGHLIKRHRLIKQLTQQELANLLNVDRQYIWKIENGKINLTLDYLDKIALKLEITNADIFKSI